MGIWNLSKGEIFFSGGIALYQNKITEAWNGKYSLDSLESFANQFVEQNKGKSHFAQDRYILWANYKEEETPSKTVIDRLMEDVPDNFFPQRDASDFIDFALGKKFTLRNNSVKVYTNTAIIPNDFTSILNAARTIMHSIYFKDAPNDLILINIELCPDSIDVNNIEMGHSPNWIHNINLSKQEEKASSYSFSISFDLEISSLFSPDSIKNHSNTSPGVRKIIDLDSILLYLREEIAHPGDIHLDKKNRLYFATPKSSHEQDLIYASKIMEGLTHIEQIDLYERSVLFWLAHYTTKTHAELIDFCNKLFHNIDQDETVRDYIQKYGVNGEISKDKLTDHLKMAINGNPLDFIDNKNEFIANYAKALVSGESI